MENKIYKRIENEIEELDKIETELIEYGYKHREIYK